MKWAWVVLQGDFKEDPSTSQIIIRILIALIFRVDRFTDVQDLEVKFS